MLLIYLSIAWITGIFLGSKFALPPWLVMAGLIPLPLLFFRLRQKLILTTSVCLILLLGGAIYYHLRIPISEASTLQSYNGKGTVEIQGRVARDPSPGETLTQIPLEAQSITLKGASRNVTGTVLLFTPRYPIYSYGDTLKVTGKLTGAPQDDLSYARYLADQGIYSTMFYPRIEKVETGTGFDPLGWINSLRNDLARVLAEVLPEPQAALAQGVVLGLRRNIPPSVQADFVNTGTAHILAVSGQNLSIIAGLLVSLGIWLFGRRRYFYIWLALLAIWLYVLLTGMQSPVVRGAIMASVFLIADLLGRQHNAFTALAFTAAIMVGVSPGVLQEASFQMSFMSMAGLIFISPIVQSQGRKLVTDRFGEDGIRASSANLVVDSFSVSLGAIIAVWPLIAHYFGVFSWVAPLANLFALPVMPVIILTGTLAGVLGFILLPVAQLIAWIAWVFLSYMLLVVRIFGLFPAANGLKIDTPFIFIYYAALALIIWIASSRSKMTILIDLLKSAKGTASDMISRLRMKWTVPSLAVVAILVWVSVASLPDDKLHTSFLDVGQGDAILFQRGTQQVLVDGGPSPEAISLALSEEMPFWDRTIDLLILTHPHADHITGLLEVLNRYRVKQVLYADEDDTSPLYSEWLKIIKEKNINYILASAGERISFGDGVMIEVLNPQTPPLTGTDSDIDNNGVVVRLEMGKMSFLITGDMQWEGESELVTRRADLASTVLKVGHHGSSTSTSDAFLGAVNPSIAVISVGKDNTYGHPTAEVVNRLKDKIGEANTYRTDMNGTIDFTTDGEKLWVKTEK